MANPKIALAEQTVHLDGRKYWWRTQQDSSDSSDEIRIWYTHSKKHAYLTDEDSNDTKVTIEEISELEKKRGDTEPPIDWKPAEHQVKTLETLRQLNASVDRAESESRHGRPTIMLGPGKLPNATDRAENVLLDHSESFKIFQRAGELVRIISLPARQVDKRLRRPRGTIQLEPLTATVLTEVFNRIARWRRKTDRGNVRVDCPPKIASSYISRVGSWKVSILAGIIAAPIIREDGSILNKSGYDSATGLYLAWDEGSPKIPEHPTLADAKSALQILLAPFAEFPFVADEDRAVHVACILTAIQRPLLRACPIFGYSAPAQRSGKSLLAESAAIVATGKPAAATAISGEREEIRKMITSVLREGHSIINLDNVEHPLASPDLAKAITQPEYQDRGLGTNRMLRLPTTVLWTATGNNLTFRKDLSSRALLSRIDARVESPEARSFKIANLADFLRKNRLSLVAAALTILRAYHVAGRPHQQVKPWGGFEDWSESIREPLIWLGLADPYKTRSVVLADDPEREETLAALRALYREFGDAKFTAKRIMSHCDKPSTLRAAIEAVAVGQHKEIDSHRLGWWLRRTKDRVLGSLRLEAVGKESGSARWRVTEVSGGHSGHGGHSPASSNTVKRYPRLEDDTRKIKRYPRLP